MTFRRSPKTSSRGSMGTGGQTIGTPPECIAHKGYYKHQGATSASARPEVWQEVALIVAPPGGLVSEVGGEDGRPTVAREPPPVASSPRPSGE